MTEELIDEVNTGRAEWTKSCFTYLSANIGSWLSSLSAETTIAYIEAEYFGGIGDQCAVVWRDGIEIMPPTKAVKVINEALRLLGVQRQGGQDEFDSVGLSRHRNVEAWVEAAGRTLEEDITRKRMIHNWRVTRSFLESAVMLIPDAVCEGSSLDTYKEYRNNNELELAFDELERLGSENSAPVDFWVELLSAAENMGLAKHVERLRQRIPASLP